MIFIKLREECKLLGLKFQALLKSFYAQIYSIKKDSLKIVPVNINKQLKGTMALTKELSSESVGRTVKLIQESNVLCSSVISLFSEHPFVC